MEEPREQPAARGDVSWGLWLILVGGLFLASTGTIKNSVAKGNGDPGPRAVPMVVSLVLIAGGLASCAAGLRQRRRQPASPAVKSILDVDDRRAIYFAAFTCCYIACVSFGFYVSSLAFASIAIWRLGAKWWTALLAGGVITAVVWGLFAKLFLVPLPSLLETLFPM